MVRRVARLVGPDLKPKTLAGYQSLLRSRILPTFGAWPIADIRPGDVDAWIAAMRRDGLSPSRIRQAHVVLSAMLDLAVRHDRIARNVARGAELPAIRRTEAPYFEPGVVDRIIGSMPERYRAFVAVQGILGARFGEAAALRRRSVDLLRRRLLVSESIAEVGGKLSFGRTKTHAERALPLPPALAARLEEHLAHVEADPEALLFRSNTGYPIRHRNFLRRVWYPTLSELGLPLVGLHVLRHSAAARMIGAGWSAKAVQSTLGHASASFTLTVYGHLFPSDMDELAAALESPRRRTGDVQAATTH
jgi:integrase